MPLHSRSNDIVSKCYNRKPVLSGDDAAVRPLNDPSGQCVSDKIVEVDGLGGVAHPTGIQVQLRRCEERGELLEAVELRVGEKTTAGHGEAHQGRGGFSRERKDGVPAEVLDDESEEGGIAVESQSAFGGFDEARREVGGEEVGGVEVDLVAAELEGLPANNNSVCII